MTATARGGHLPLIQLLVLTSVVLLAGAAGRELHGTPTFYASLIRELVDDDDWLHIFRGPDAYLLKPPLVLWAGALGSTVFGLGNFGVTLFPRFAAIACVALTYLLVRQLAGARAGWLAGLVLLTNSTFIQFSTTLRMDSALLCGMLLVLTGWLALPARRGSVAVFGGLSLGLLAKGPLVLFVLPLCALWSTPARDGRLQHLRWRWAALLLPALLWYGFVFALHGSQQISDLGSDLVRPNPDATDAAWRTYVFEYLQRPAERYWPWLPLMLAGFVMGYTGGGSLPSDQRRALRWCGLWCLLVLAMCALKPDRDIRYLYIALPALAGLAAIPLAHWLGPRADRWLLPAAGMLTLGVAVAAALGVGTRDTRATVAAMRDALAVSQPALAGRPPVVIGDYPLQPGQPRRQLNQRDWIHFYLGIVPRIVPWSRVESGALDGEPLVFTIRAGDYTGRLAAAGFAPRLVSKEMVMAVPK